jgi:hypothetical protein
MYLWFFSYARLFPVTAGALRTSFVRSNKSPDAPMTRPPGSFSGLPLALYRLRFVFPDTVQNKLVITALRSVFYAAEKPIRRTVAIAAIDRALRDAMLLSHFVVTNERLIADNNLLGVGLA